MSRIVSLRLRLVNGLLRLGIGYREGDLARGRVNRIVTGMSAECVIRPMTLFVFV